MSNEKAFDNPFVGFFAVIIGAVYFASMIAIPLLAEGFVLKVMWNWYIPFAFVQAPRLNLGEAVGLTLVVGVLRFRGGSTQEARKPTGQFLKDLFLNIGILGIALLIGWVASLFIL